MLVTLCTSRKRDRLCWAEHGIILSPCVSCLETSWKIWGSTSCHHSFWKNIICCHGKCWGKSGLWCNFRWRLSGCSCCFGDSGCQEDSSVCCCLMIGGCTCCFREGGCQEDSSLCCCLMIRGWLGNKSCFSKMPRGNGSLSRGGCLHWRGWMEKS